MQRVVNAFAGRKLSRFFQTAKERLKKRAISVYTGESGMHTTRTPAFEEQAVIPEAGLKYTPPHLS